MAILLWRCILQRRCNWVLPQVRLYHGSDSAGSTHQARAFCTQVAHSPFKAERLPRPRGALWRTRKILSNEALTVIRRMVRHQDDEAQLKRVIKQDLSRLLKLDMMSVFKEVIRERMPDLCRLVFHEIKKEPWYKPELFVYRDIMFVFAKKRRAAEVEELFEEMKSAGLEPELNCYTELLRAYVYTFQVEKIHKTVEEMKEMGCHPDLQIYRLLCVGLSSTGDREAAMRYRMELFKAQHENTEPAHEPVHQTQDSGDRDGPEVEVEVNVDVSDDEEQPADFKNEPLDSDEEQPMDSDDDF